VTPAFHLTQLLEKKIYSVKNPNLNVNLELTKDQHDQTNQLLIENINIFSENILEDGQSKELEQTD
ncbi:156_t:CDS:1, partial [Racocetra persica]